MGNFCLPGFTLVCRVSVISVVAVMLVLVTVMLVVVSPLMVSPKLWRWHCHAELGRQQ